MNRRFILKTHFLKHPFGSKKRLFFIFPLGCIFLLGFSPIFPHKFVVKKCNQKYKKDDFIEIFLNDDSGSEFEGFMLADLRELVHNSKANVEQDFDS